jgi:membrane protein
MVRYLYRLWKKTIANFIGDQCPRLAAALAYYSFFALPPLLVITVGTAGYVARLSSFSAEGDARKFLVEQVETALGADAANQIDTIITKASNERSRHWGLFGGTAVLLIGASGVVIQLQQALNEIWRVRPVKNGFRRFLVKRVVSMALVLGAGFVLIVATVMGTLLASLSDYGERLFPEQTVALLPSLMNNGTILMLAILLFAGIFKWLPDARIPWRETWIGAVFTALLFVGGKTLLVFYFANARVMSTFGAAGSLALILA